MHVFGIYPTVAVAQIVEAGTLPAATCDGHFLLCAIYEAAAESMLCD
jgi:hypothetical protein